MLKNTYFVLDWWNFEWHPSNVLLQMCFIKALTEENYILPIFLLQFLIVFIRTIETLSNEWCLQYPPLVRVLIMLLINDDFFLVQNIVKKETYIAQRLATLIISLNFQAFSGTHNASVIYLDFWGFFVQT